MRVLTRAVTALALVWTLVACTQEDGGRVEDDPGDPSATSGPPSSPPTAPAATEGPATTTALFFGDSYFVGGGYTEASNSMANLAAQELGWTAVIRGGGGTGFVAGNDEYGIANFIGQIQQGALDVDDPAEVDWLVIEGGGNDKDEDPQAVEERAVEVLREAASRFPDARLVLVGTLDPTLDDFSDTDGVIGALRSAAEARAVPFVDAQRWLEGRFELIGPDFDHPTPEGHVVSGHDLAEALSRLTRH